MAIGRHKKCHALLVLVIEAIKLTWLERGLETNQAVFKRKRDTALLVLIWRSA